MINFIEYIGYDYIWDVGSLIIWKIEKMRIELMEKRLRETDFDTSLSKHNTLRLDVIYFQILSASNFNVVFLSVRLWKIALLFLRQDINVDHFLRSFISPPSLQLRSYCPLILLSFSKLYIYNLYRFLSSFLLFFFCFLNGVLILLYLHYLQNLFKLISPFWFWRTFWNFWPRWTKPEGILH